MANCIYCNKSICDCKQVCDSCKRKVEEINQRPDLTAEEKQQRTAALKQT